MEQPKRVATLYRVSTMGQVDGDDIPVQRNACRDFINKQDNWSLVIEYIEKGVSGYKISESKRDVLQGIKKDAEQGLFDVLLVFMMDRLGRKEDETPFVVEFFTKLGIEVWSVKEGQRKIENHADKLMNYLSFWQSSGESVKTSIRVSEAQRQMIEQGRFKGGTAPYGYDLVKSGVLNKKGKDLLKLKINEEQAEVVREIWRLSDEEMMGGKRIATLLNERGVPSGSGGKWNSSVVNYMRRNPVYKGYLSYGKNTQKGRSDESDWILSKEKNPDIAIIDEELWDRVYNHRKKFTPENTLIHKNVYKSTKGSLLFVGMINCGHCGSPLTTTYNKKTWKNKDGTIKGKQRILYRCSGKALGKTNCDGQTLYAKTKIEDLIMSRLNVYLDQLKKKDLTNKINEFKSSNSDMNKSKLKKLQTKNEANYKELAVLTKEVSKSIMGESSFKPEMLSNLIEEKEKEISQLSNDIFVLQEEINSNDVELEEIMQLQKHIPVWSEVFTEANDNQKKKMLSTIVKQVTVFRDNIDIEIRLNIKKFMGLGDVKEGQAFSRFSSLHTPIINKKISVQINAKIS